jgi:3alpha(or 20beta)-hydroxysteroid dehydrogenase
MDRLAGKVAIVTGGARGTGRGIVEAFVAEGATVLIADVLDERGEDTANATGSAYRHLDVTDEAAWTACLEHVRATHGRLDVLVNNAAILHLQALADTSTDDFDRVMRVNTLGPFLGIKACLPLFIDSGGGSIVNIGSVDSISGTPCTAAYTSSKFALRGLTKVVAIEHGKHHIRCNIVCPGGGSAEMVMEAFARTGTTFPAGEAVRREIAEGATANVPPPDRPIARRGTANDFAMAAVYFASDESSFCSGTELVVDGGFHSGQFVDVPGLWMRQ